MAVANLLDVMTALSLYSMINEQLQSAAVVGDVFIIKSD